jgi:hypothetical protein
MKTHWRKALRSFEVLAYLVKDKDPDGIEIRFSSSPSRREHNKNRAPLLDSLKKTKPSGQWDIGFTLGGILREYDWAFSQEKKGLGAFWRNKNKKQKWGVNIYVFTDGVWEEGEDWLESVVNSINNLLANGVDPHQIGIQFIQFGNDPEGTRRLEVLDDGLRQHGVPK